MSKVCLYSPQNVRLHPRDVRAVLAGGAGPGGGVQRRRRHRRERGAARQLHDQDHPVTKGELAPVPADKSARI